ncbi:antibiotic biosynthesis monooxygenase [Caulobacter zeae]|uniref:Antibiotic biosynthesis monooxygenase n=1 Tax=Caulobacter zeae TaxID=2055137 RepID=A0A2N5D768_9CAUL|nr:putative quinol monooxygenase [Caulobacter zeae]PLR21908.1 antibiotic biosynthesis monooxygenase [Caulobacter zeae]
MSTGVKIVAVLAAKEGMGQALEALLLGMAGACRAEPGNLRWDVWRDQADPTRFVLDELYVDDAAVTAHRASAHFVAYLARIGDLAERTALVLDPADLG